MPSTVDLPPHALERRNSPRHSKQPQINCRAPKSLRKTARFAARLLILCLGLCPLAYGQETGKPVAPLRAPTATGPLRRNTANPRYFTDGSGKAIYLTGSHTWSNLMDRGTLHPPQVPFDYPTYMKWMVARNFNFMRLWTAELTDSADTDDVDENVVAMPWKWMRTGPGYANDGGLKFDLAKFDQSYFDRMRGSDDHRGPKRHLCFHDAF